MAWLSKRIWVLWVVYNNWQRVACFHFLFKHKWLVLCFRRVAEKCAAIPITRGAFVLRDFTAARVSTGILVRRTPASTEPAASTHPKRTTCASARLAIKVNNAHVLLTCGVWHVPWMSRLKRVVIPLGPNCGEEIDYCVLKPCQNEGQCSSRDSGYHCFCLSGFEGTSSVVFSCFPFACSFPTCICPCVGFDCELDVDECQSNPCVQGYCQNLPGTFACVCNQGYTGTDRRY